MPLQCERKPGSCHTAVNVVFPTSGCKRHGQVAHPRTSQHPARQIRIANTPHAPLRILAGSCGVHGVRGVRNFQLPPYNNYVNSKRERTPRTPRHTSPRQNPKPSISCDMSLTPSRRTCFLHHHLVCLQHTCCSAFMSSFLRTHLGKNFIHRDGHFYVSLKASSENTLLFLRLP